MWVHMSKTKEKKFSNLSLSNNYIYIDRQIDRQIDRYFVRQGERGGRGGRELNQKAFDSIKTQV